MCFIHNQMLVDNFSRKAVRRAKFIDTSIRFIETKIFTKTFKDRFRRLRYGQQKILLALQLFH